MAIHSERQGYLWKAGDPQGGFSVEVSDPSGTGIQITGITSNLVDTMQVGDTLHLTVDAVSNTMQPIDYQFFCSDCIECQ